MNQDMSTRQVVIGAGAILVTLIMLFAFITWRDHTGSERWMNEHCTEDMDCWVCEDMGNGICGKE